ncbi:hypothetical protein [Mycolicibacterium fallax]|uniref:Uncharacterized protein n=1 Tax=Mycolicibacterium fallax TaxID=1793 RepID=A0A1X1RIY5_MYCFA|nr:hypothetical protein [Mycolicibacterium fallax]ORV07523.1 hypothetical protein AWC04_03680 [Mycolicibacterium fallax]BBY99435.1 hypothetical protein MFAL_29020 [Mycolicibacterium fallax]
MSTIDDHPLAPLMPYRSSTCIGISVPRGWEKLVLDLHEKLIAVDPKLVYHQVKEKYGEVRVYISSTVPETRDLIREAELKSRRTCESCGDAGMMHQSNRGWYRTLCPLCANEYQQGYTPVPTKGE